MQFTKAIISFLLAAAPMGAMAAPSADDGLQARNPFGDDIDSLIAELVGLSESDAPATLKARGELEARAGWTCSFLAGNKGCQVKVS